MKDWPFLRELRRQLQFARRTFESERRRTERGLQVSTETSSPLGRNRGAEVVALRPVPVREHLCHGCGYCEVLCPAEALRLETANLAAAIAAGPESSPAPLRFELDPLRCVGCGLCLEICPVSALEGSEGYGPILDRSGLRSSLVSERTEAEES